MKILLDDNLSPKLVNQLSHHFTEITHVRLVGLSAAPDMNIWQWAKINNYLICTKDSDFYHHAILNGPPKVLWLRLGNCSNQDIETTLCDNAKLIQNFWDEPKEKVLIIGS